MKRLLAILFCVSMVIGTVGVAGAVPYSWVDTHNPSPDKFIGWWDSYSYSHNIIDNGFNVGQDEVTAYSLKVRLYDDGGKWDFAEIAYIDQPGLLSGGLYDFSKTFDTFGWSISGVVDLNEEGELDITVQSLLGDFYFDYSELNASGNKGAVPEPSTMLMLLPGLAGMVGLRRFFK